MIGVLPPKSRSKSSPKTGGREFDDIYAVSIGYRKSYDRFGTFEPLRPLWPLTVPLCSGSLYLAHDEGQIPLTCYSGSVPARHRVHCAPTSQASGCAGRYDAPSDVDLREFRQTRTQGLGVANCKHNRFGLQTSRFFDRTNCGYRGFVRTKVRNPP